MTRLAIGILVLLLESCAARKPHGLRAVPPDLGVIAWTTSPADVIERRQVGTSVVWVGKVAEFTYAERDRGLVVEWICDYLPFASPGEQAIRQRPIAVGSPTNERFLVNLVKVGMPVERAEALKQQYAIRPHYLVVAGTVDAVDAVVSRHGLETVFLHTKSSHYRRTWSPVRCSTCPTRGCSAAAARGNADVANRTEATNENGGR